VGFTEIELRKIEEVVGEYCRTRIPARIRDKLRLTYSVEGQSVVLYEERLTGITRISGRVWISPSCDTSAVTTSGNSTGRGRVGNGSCTVRKVKRTTSLS